MFGIRVGRRPGRRLTGADRTRVYSPAVSRVRVATPVAQSLKQRGGVRLEQQPRPHTGGLGPPPSVGAMGHGLFPHERPAVDAAARLEQRSQPA